MLASATLTLQRMSKHTDVMLAVGVLAVIMIMMVPLPTWIMDFLLAINIAIGVLILLTAIYVLKPLEFSIFPSLLLLTTLFRLSLNVATTRLILLHGQEGTAAAGHVIEGFGQFVVGGNTVVGLIIFIVLVLINFIVITKGSTRIAEVAARFTLDAMPGKQMAIDADLNAGMISEEQARQRREDVAREAEFYGSMDGAAKFVRGDAVAGLIITAINLIAGVIIGTAQQGMSMSDAINVYSILTVGDGLVSQIPALIISTAAGIVITRAGSGATMSIEISDQFTAHPRVHYVAAGAMLFMSFVPGLPFIPFIMLSIGLGFTGWYLQTAVDNKAAKADVDAEAIEAPKKEEEQPMSDLLVVDPVRLEVGYGLIDLVEGSGDGNLLERLQTVRRQIAQEIGFVLPPVHIKDNLQLGVGDYRVLVRGAEVGRSEIRPRNLLALEGQVAGMRVEGVPTQEPAFGLPALWITQDKRQQAELSGYTVVEPVTVVVTHITEILRVHAAEMLDRAQTRELVEMLSERYPKVVDDIVPAQVSYGLLQNVLQRLLSEWVPIRDLLLIIETIADGLNEQKDMLALVEKVRLKLGRSIVQRYLDEQNELAVFTIDPAVEQTMSERLAQAPAGTMNLPLDFNQWQRFITRFTEISAQQQVDIPVLLTTPVLRPHLALSLSKVMSRIAVISVAEIPSRISVRTLSKLSLNDAN
ncbi:flagellar biosynthesis protein FlhA [Ghiorsea bivora]|uniref:flagellar biosynthesis protein FlhA n=1 Tax=Ghiorsea bivora TaxID=1485545 RepID=UPI00056FD7AD|nr:flagellar biosynthesis protein FlhA [Ghiorsea bivora]